MRILLLSDTYSEHTERWALGLASNGIEVGLFSFNKASYAWYKNKKNITLLFEPHQKLDTTSKLSYLKFVRILKKAIIQFKPDVLHAHYATSYGLIGALSGFHPFIISAWGTDVMKFPQKNFINKLLLNYNLRKADAICATSNTIKSYIKNVIDKTVHVVSFGVDTDLFKPNKEVGSNNGFTIGSIKPIEKIYNIHILLEAFSILKKKYPTDNLNLLIVGEGTESEKLKTLSQQLNISDCITFTGRINHSDIPNYFNKIDVLVNISEYESFGVSVIEAMACKKPVVATNVGGLKEIIETSEYGTLVDVGDVNGTAEAIEAYFLNKELREKVGNNARKKVIELYNWEDNLTQMINLYKDVLSD